MNTPPDPNLNLQQTLLTGSDEDLEEAMSNALVVDHRSEEKEVLGEFGRLVPGFAFSHVHDGKGGCDVAATYQGRRARWAYREIPHNCFRVVQDVQRLIAPDVAVRVYAPTMGDDTHIFVPLGRDFWQRFDAEASAARRKMFEGIEFLDSAWELSGPPGPAAGGDKKWWKLW